MIWSNCFDEDDDDEKRREEKRREENHNKGKSNQKRWKSDREDGDILYLYSIY